MIRSRHPCVLLLLYMCAGGVRAQFIGGASDGASAQTLAQLACAATPAVMAFNGGARAGASAAVLIQTVCAPVPAISSYYGGVNDGAAGNALGQSTCAPVPAVSGYIGGTADGASDNALSQSVCAPVPVIIGYIGGVSDGAAWNAFGQTSCTPQPAVIGYLGGPQDGASANNLSQSACTPARPVVAYMSGVGDGFELQVLQRTICAGITPLPIELVGLTATCKDEGVLLEWSTASELNNAYFTVERSSDATDWEQVGTLDGAGDSEVMIEYAYLDDAPHAGFTYYRLKQTDLDGTFSHTGIVAVDCAGGGAFKVLLYPNPASEEMTIEVPGVQEPLHFQIFNAQGARVREGLVTMRSVVPVASLADGVYSIRIETPDVVPGLPYRELRFVKQ